MDWHKRYVQQAAWTKDLRSYLFGQAGLETADMVLEVGCGTGAILADLNTPAAVHGIDLERTCLIEAHLHAPQAVLACGDAISLPFASGTFDISFCHFLLLWVGDPLQALCEMKRVTHPGGSILALAEPDYNHRVDKPEALAPLGRWQAESLQRQGADPGLGKQLALLFHQAGIPLVETGSFHTEATHPPSPGDQDLEWAVLEADLAGRVPAEDILRLKNLDEQAWERGERVLNVPTFWAFGKRGVDKSIGV
jgi:SAM-dependent methyltransferase